MAASAPCLPEFLALRVGNDADPIQRLIRICLDQAAQRGAQKGEDPVYIVCRELRSVIADTQTNLIVIRCRDKGEWVIGMVDGAAAGELRTLAFASRQIGVERIVLEDEQAVEQGGAGRHCAVPLDLGQGHEAEAAVRLMLCLQRV